MGLNSDKNIEITGWAAPDACLSFAGNPQAKAVINAGGNLDIDPPNPPHLAGSSAPGALGLYGLTLTGASGTCPDIDKPSEGTLLNLLYLSRPIALRTGVDRRAGFCLITIAVGADFTSGYFYLCLDAEGRLLKLDLQSHVNIGTPLGTPLALTAHAAAEEHVENIAKALKVAKPAETAEVSKIPETSEATCAVWTFKGSVSELIILLPQLLIAENPVGFADFLEFLLGIGVLFVYIRVVLAREAAVCFFDLRLRGIPINPQDLVVISLGHKCTAFLCQFNGSSPKLLTVMYHKTAEQKRNLWQMAAA
jgi:hypothetical protein